MAASLSNPAWVEWMTSLMEGVSRQRYAATFPPDRFYCLLDELPVHLIPQPARRFLTEPPESTAFYLNPDCHLCGPGELPMELESCRELVSRFALQGSVAWVRDSSGTLPLPFWLGPESEAMVRSLKLDEPAPSSVPEGMRSLLRAARILVPENRFSKQGTKTESMIERARALFREKGYAPLAGLIHPFHVAALRRYYRHLLRTGAIRLGDGQSPRRYVAHNEPVARFFHHRIAATLAAVAGEPIKPSYVYLASYLSGARLEKHTDREQCEFSITLCLDFAPEPKLASPWPICLDTATGTATVYQGLGDGLAYRGTRLPHYRGKLPQGQTSTSIFFHYVSEEFRGPLG